MICLKNAYFIFPMITVKIYKEKLWIPKSESPGVVDQIKSEVNRYESMSPP